MNKESALIKRIEIWATQRGWRLGRNSKGGGWVGDKVATWNESGRKGPVRMVSINNARFLLFGLLFPGAKGGESDLIGWRTLRVTPEMVGTRIAQFAALEAKTPNVRMTKEQINFLTQVNRAGGYGVIIREREGEIVVDEGREAAEVADV